MKILHYEKKINKTKQKQKQIQKQKKNIHFRKVIN